MALEWRYLPILKWKRAEVEALRKLTATQWEGVTPLVELQPIGVAPEVAALKSALPGYLDKVAEDFVKAIPADRKVFVDTHLVSAEYSRPANLLFVIIERLIKKTGLDIYPVIGTKELSSFGHLAAQHKDHLKNTSVLLRLRSDQIEASQVQALIADLEEKGGNKQNIHVLIDQHSIVSRDSSGCLTSVVPYLVEARASSCASVTYGGGSFPSTLTGYKAGASQIHRVEWGVWTELSTSGEYPGLRYADYAVTNPEPLPEDLDPTKVNPAIAIRYAREKNWHLLKGKGFKGAPPGEYRGLCKLLVTDAAVYSGKGFCFGDAKYFEASQGGEKNGVPWTWRREATNHHIVFTASSL